MLAHRDYDVVNVTIPFIKIIITSIAVVISHVTIACASWFNTFYPFTVIVTEI